MQMYYISFKLSQIVSVVHTAGTNVSGGGVNWWAVVRHIWASGCQFHQWQFLAMQLTLGKLFTLSEPLLSAVGSWHHSLLDSLTGECPSACHSAV